MLRIFLIRLIGFCLTSVAIVKRTIWLLTVYPFSRKAKLITRNRKSPPPILNNRKWGDHKYIKFDNGIKLHYVEKGDPKNPMMLFLHGFPEFWFLWRHQIEHFSKKYWCIAPDNRGYGDSDKPEGIENYHIFMLADDVKDLIQGLGRSQCILVAHDWGGAIGYSFCDRYPEMVKAYFPLNIPHPDSLMRERERSWEQSLKSWYIMMFQCPWIPEQILRCGDLDFFDNILFDAKISENGKNEKVEEVTEAFKYTFSQPNAFTAPLNYYRNIIQIFQAENHGQMKKITKVPVLSIFGTADKALSVAAAKGGADFVEKFETILLDGVSHWSPEERPDEINKHIDNYLDSFN